MNPPIVLFVYARPTHTRKTVAALLRNFGAEEHDLIVYSDGAKGHDTRHLVEQVRDYISDLKGFKSVKLNVRKVNLGLGNSIISGVTEVLSQFENIIVLEDDLVTSPFFLQYMNRALDLYSTDERIISIHGYVYPVQSQLPEAFFLRGADCLGWGTWRRGWRLFNPSGDVLLRGLRERRLCRAFDFNGSYPYCKMLRDQIRGLNDSWAIRWYASAFLNNKLTLYPGRSLVHHIGSDGSGTNFGCDATLDTELSASPIDLRDIQVRHCEVSEKVFESFFRRIRTPPVKRLLNKIKHLFS